MENLEIEYIKRARGTVLAHNGKEYYQQVKYSDQSSLWRCSNYAKNKCVGSVKISLENKILKYKEHHTNCKVDENRLLTRNLVTACIEEAVKAEDTVPAAYKKVVSSFEDEGINFVSKIPSYHRVKSTIYRHRNQSFLVDRVSNSNAQDLQIPPQFADLLLADYNDEDGRILIFATKEAREMIKDVKILLLDGTFEVCPSPFVELYTIHGDLGSCEDFTNIIPLIYVLVTNKTKHTYVKMFEMIKSNISLSPTEIITDFEKAAIAAVRQVFPEAQHHGCYFHFTRALWKRAKKLRLTKNIFKKRIISLCTALPLLPYSMLEQGWTYIKSESDNIDDDNGSLKRFIKYVDSFWMKNNFRRTWCCFGLKHRTTNSVENWHHTFKGYFKRTPPQFLLFLKKMTDDATFQKIKARKILYGSRKNQKKRDISRISRDQYILENQLQLTVNEISVEMFLNKVIFLNHI